VREELSEEEYQLLIEDNNQQLAKLMREQRELNEILTHQKENFNFKELITQLERFIQEPKLDEEILHKLIERIEIKEDGSPRIFYRFSNSYKSSIFLRATHSTPHALS
jgi:site-specific DNA recombinase